MRTTILSAALFLAACGGGETTTGEIPPATTKDSTSDTKPRPKATESATADTPPATPAAGKVDPQLIRAAMRAVVPKMQECYEKSLEKDPKIAGKLVFKMVLKLDGTFDVATDKDATTMPADVVTCAVDVVKTASMPKPEGGPVNVTYPIDFAPGPEPTITGKVEAAEVRKAVGTSRPKTSACFAEAQKKDPKVQGTVIVKFSVGAKGSAEKPSVTKESTIKDADLHKCLVEAIKGVTFPKPKAGKVDVTYPFEFKPFEFNPEPTK